MVAHISEFLLRSPKSPLIRLAARVAFNTPAHHLYTHPDFSDVLHVIVQHSSLVHEIPKLLVPHLLYLGGKRPLRIHRLLSLFHLSPELGRVSSGVLLSIFWSNTKEHVRALPIPPKLPAAQVVNFSTLVLHW
jgi:hypothetical protein